MQVFFLVAHLIIGTLQLFAIWDGVKYATDLGNFLSFMLAAFTTYIPLLGSALGVYGAVNVWDWNLLQSIMLFFWFIPVFFVFFIYSMLTDK